jgi:hypothetical protein
MYELQAAVPRAEHQYEIYDIKRRVLCMFVVRHLQSLYLTSLAMFASIK